MARPVGQGRIVSASIDTLSPTLVFAPNKFATIWLGLVQIHCGALFGFAEEAPGIKRRDKQGKEAA